MGRKKVRIIESKALCRLLLLVSRGINYAQVISKETGNKPSPVVKQLKILEKTGYLNKPKKEKLLNKSVYSINYEKICDEFIEYYIRALVNHYGDINNNQGFHSLKKMLHPKIEKIKKYFLSIKNNKILLDTLKKSLSSYEPNDTKKTTLERVFFFVFCYIDDIAERKVKIENSKDLAELIKLSNMSKNLKKEYSKEFYKAREEWIEETLKKSSS
ncbi:hypothetical protein HY500_01375 [Candidatus Woesearchaeota archaeon]|nr:hypothetical protein [Candidatus Woesearchaeota archaeon]